MPTNPPQSGSQHAHLRRSSRLRGRVTPNDEETREERQSPVDTDAMEEIRTRVDAEATESAVLLPKKVITRKPQKTKVVAGKQGKTTRGKRRTLSRLPDMPLDVLYEVFS